MGYTWVNKHNNRIFGCVRKKTVRPQMPMLVVYQASVGIELDTDQGNLVVKQYNKTLVYERGEPI